MKTGEIDILRIAVAVGVNVLTARYVARLVGFNPDIGSAAAVGAMLYASTPAKLNGSRTEMLLRSAAETLTAPGSIVVNVLAEQSAPVEIIEPVEPMESE